ncbi:MAG: hypothetical protein K6V97_12605 [Actinomycetia bacterium]|nr:hypothetical protein [Actinomycetes bacterium]
MVRYSGIWAGIALAAGLGMAGFLFGAGSTSVAGQPSAGSAGSFGWPLGMMPGLPDTGHGVGYGSSMMGGFYGGVPGSNVNGTGRTVTAAATARMGNAIPAGASVDQARNRILFTVRKVQLDVVGSPMGQKDETFRIAGLVNPTIVVPKGATIHVTFVNADPDMSHNFVVTPAMPPFAYGAMMQAALAFPGALTPVLGPSSGNAMQVVDASFIATSSGRYTYLCTVPGHAEHGMYGSLVVQA